MNTYDFHQSDIRPRAKRNDIASRYRPEALADFAGNDKAVRAAEFNIRRGIGGRGFWLTGASGIGKTTLARIMTASIADEFFVTEYDSAQDLTAAEIDNIRQTMLYSAGGKGGRAWIINEAHALTNHAVKALLGILERLPEHCAVFFTTTRVGQEMLFEDQADAGPLTQRCTPIALTSQGLSKPFAARFREIALSEGFDVPEAKATRILASYENSMRAALEWIGGSESMEFLIGEAVAA